MSSWRPSKRQKPSKKNSLVNTSIAGRSAAAGGVQAAVAVDEQQLLQQRFSLRVTTIGGDGTKTDLPVFEHQGAKYVAAENGTAFEVTIDDAATPDSVAATPVALHKQQSHSIIAEEIPPTNRTTSIVVKS